MEFTKCFEILSERTKGQHDVSCPCCTQPVTQPVQGSRNNVSLQASTPSSSVVSFHETEWNNMKNELVNETHDLATISSIDVVQKVINLQRMRIQIYQFFDKELSTILIQGDLDQYPGLCAKMTEYFSAISSSIIRIKDFSKELSISGFIASIENLQKLEKDKLMFVAAHHLDQMQPKLPVLKSVMGDDCAVQKSYLAQKISETESAISEEVENLQAIKIDLSE